MLYYLIIYVDIIKIFQNIPNTEQILLIFTFLVRILTVLPVFQVPLLETISTAKARGAVEKWLLELEGIMLRSIREVGTNIFVWWAPTHYYLKVLLSSVFTWVYDASKGAQVN